ncbi:MAG: serine hydrolase [Clostridia bacterium]|nr:serine hydrolase [Clostridia bacterium]
MFRNVSPEQVGISSERVLEYIKTLDNYKLKTHSIIFARGDKIFAECYYKPFNRDFKHRMYSVSKSFVAIAVGLAEQEGLLSLDDTLASFFPEYVTESHNERFFEATVRDMLTMRSAMVDTAPWWGMLDRAAAYFTKNSRQIPGTNFQYDSAGSFLLGCIVEKITGKLFLDYLKEKIFLDAGFSKDAYCLLAPGGHSHGDSGVMCSARDLLIFARLLMNKGKLNGKQYLSEDFCTEAISKQTATDEISEISFYQKYGYGYGIWKMPRDGFAFIGMSDQYVICDPKTDFVFIINSENYESSPTSKTIIMHELYKSIIENLGEPLDENPENYERLKDYLESRTLISLSGITKSPLLAKVNGAKFIMEDDVSGIEYVKLTFSGKAGIFEYKNADGINKIKFGLGYNEFSQFPGKKRMGLTASVYEDGTYECAASAVWADENKLHIMVQIIDTYMGTLNIALGFKDNRISVRMRKHAQRILDNYDIKVVGYKESVN